MKKHTGLAAGLLFAAVCVAQVQSPDQFFPHKYMQEFTPHHLIVDYYQHVAQESDQVHLIEYGRTNEHRPLLLAFVSTSENIDNLEEIRLNNRRLTGLESDDPDPDDAKAIVWLSYSVHGNESAGTEAAPQVLYDLVEGNDEAGDWLQNTVVIIDPCINPDGFNRYSSWNTQVSAKTYDANPMAREHHEPWPGGRMNHYYFDLNRDWVWQTQKESRHRIVEYRRWMPHVHVDLHEQGYTAPYYFAPAAEPFHPFITDWQREFQTTIGKNHAAYFDEYGWRYFTKEIFDLFYPSYGDTYPTFNGAIGMTYEQGGSGFAGRGIQLPNGDTLSLKDRIIHHATTSMSTVEITSMHADEVITQFKAYFSGSSSDPPGEYKTFVVKGHNAQGKLKALCELLDLQGIVYGKPSVGVNTANGFNYTTGETGSFSIEPDDLVVSAYQPRAVLTQVLFEPEGELVDSLSYDITAWSLPHAYDVEAYAMEGRIEVSAGYAFDDSDSVMQQDAYAYAVRWESMGDVQFVARSLKEGLRPRYANQEFTVHGNSYAAGTVLYMEADHRNKPGWRETLADISDELTVTVESIQTGFVESGKDFGSSSYRLIDMPDVLTISGARVSAYSCGQIWYMFEQVLDYPLTIVDITDLDNIDLNEFDVIVLPEGWYSIPENLHSDLQSWLRSGGKVIAIGSALENFADKDGYALKRYARDDAQNESKRKAEEEALELRLEPYTASERRRISERVPGAIFEAQVDETHPLGFGLGSTYFTLKTSSRAYDHQTGAVNVVYLDDEFSHYGFAGARALDELKNSIVFAEEQKGRGSIIYMVDNPLFRAFWENGKFVFSNALFLTGN